MLLSLLAIPVLFGSSVPVAPTPMALPSYLTVEQADAIAAGLYGVQAYLVATPGERARLLSTASMRIDYSRRWQGRKVADAQPLEFPRIDGCRLIVADLDGNAAVPFSIKIATVYEAASLKGGDRAGRIAAAHDGLQSQQIGSAIESYFAPTTSRGTPVLCLDADRAVDAYRLRTGRLR